MKFTVTEEKSLLEQLQKIFPDSSNRTLRSWIENGRIEVNGAPSLQAKKLLLPGDQLVVGSRRETLDSGIQILYEDRDLVVIHKPIGLLSVATDYEKGKTAHSFLKDRAPGRRVWVIHRLDRETSGVMIFAYSEKAYESLKADLKARKVKREYSAVVEGSLEEESGTFESYLVEDSNYQVHTTDDPDEGQLAITHFEVVQTSPQYTHLNIRLETGRKNQIRVHCQEAGHPIVGDTKYGAMGSPIKRLCLHAKKLTFRHPIKGEIMSFESPTPHEFQRLTTRRRDPHA